MSICSENWLKICPPLCNFKTKLYITFAHETKNTACSLRYHWSCLFLCYRSLWSCILPTVTG